MRGVFNTRRPTPHTLEGKIFLFGSPDSSNLGELWQTMICLDQTLDYYPFKLAN